MLALARSPGSSKPELVPLRRAPGRHVPPALRRTAPSTRPCMQMVLHYAEDPAAAIAEAARVLRPGGTADRDRPAARTYQHGSSPNGFAHRWPGFSNAVHGWRCSPSPGYGSGRPVTIPGPLDVRHMAQPRPTPPSPNRAFRRAHKELRMNRPHLLDALRDRVLLCDGGMGSRVQALTLDVEKRLLEPRELHGSAEPVAPRDGARDPSRLFRGRRRHGGNQQLRRQPDHPGGIRSAADRTHEINKVAGELAREAADSFADGRHRWVVGSIGPGTKLPSLGNIAYDPLEAALAEQSAGLIAGGVDAILIETCQDTLQIKAAVNGAKRARAAAGTDTPIFVQVTVETTGTLLVGPDIAAAATVIHALDVPLIGLNCATGAAGDGRARALARRQLARPDLACSPMPGCPNWSTAPPTTRSARRRWRAGSSASSLEDGLNLVGGCCGTSIEHIAALDAMLRKARRPPPGARRAQPPLGPRRRQPVWPDAPAAGEQLFLHRRALQRQRLQANGASCRRRATGTAASPWGASRSARAPTAWTSAPPSSAATRCRR